MKVVIIVENRGHALFVARMVKAFGRRARIKKRRAGKKTQWVVYID